MSGKGLAILACRLAVTFLLAAGGLFFFAEAASPPAVLGLCRGANVVLSAVCYGLAFTVTLEGDDDDDSQSFNCRM